MEAATRQNQKPSRSPRFIMKLIFATHNQNKLKELQLLLPKSIELLSLDDVGYKEEIAETADTLEGNAILKARCIYEKFGENCFADDSGLEVEILEGAPGVYSARYGGEQKSDADNNLKLLSEMEGKSDRKACFKAVIALILDGKEHVFEGRIDGEILPEPRGTFGFGYDPLFKPDGFQKTFAQMEITEKIKINHRARAVNKLVDFLKGLSH